MPLGAMVNSGALAIGGLAGAIIQNKLSEETKKLLTNLMGLCAIVIAIINIVKLHNLSTVILSLILGVLVGEAIKLDNRIQAIVNKIIKQDKTDVIYNNSDWMIKFCAIITLFVASGTGTFGILKEGFEGDSSILIAKAILDFFTACIFASSLGKAVAFISIPQFCIYLILFYFARLIFPIINEHQIMNFNAIGGLIDLAIGLTILNIKKFKTINFLPAFIIVFPVTLFFEYL
ncbi:MAG: DUF554 domain-containing protein [Lachnospiraceae bacterium]|nr:DUF554 domain-containing protein [Lachnospiraceae bacterium]